MEWITENPQLALAVTAILASVAGYIYRSRVERKQALNQAWFHLAKIWYAVTLATANPAAGYDRVIDRLRRMLPPDAISAEDAEAFRTVVSAMVQPLLRWQAMESSRGFVQEYDEVVKSVAQSSPVLAYDLTSASRSRRQLELLDVYLDAATQVGGEGSPDTASHSDVRENFLNYAHRDAARELETNLRRLAWRAGLRVWISTWRRLATRKKYLRSGPSDAELDEYLRSVVIPLL